MDALPHSGPIRVPEPLRNELQKINHTRKYSGPIAINAPKNLNNYTSGYQVKNWSVPGQDNNEQFEKWIYNDASDWIGEFSETVFEVNMLVIDEKNVLCMKDYPPLTEWLHKRGITVHTFDFRPRSFFDGGWHCLTLDIHREDTLTDLFPERGDNGVYYREDMG